jgi:transglutaminase-like putative cysteine protease
MSSAGSLGRESARTVLALLVVVGLVLVAVVLPAIGHEAPGRSLVPGGSDAANRDAVQRALQGQQGSAASGGGDSLLGGAMGNLPRQGANSLGGPRGGGAGGPGSGSGFGALNPGASTGVGASESLVSESLRSRSSRAHFVVESRKATYWRTGAYETYTGDGWENERTGRRDLPLVDAAGGERERLVQRITLKQPAAALPSAWQPVNVRGVSGVRATPRKALRTDERLPANTTYRVTSSVPVHDPETIRDAGRDYPVEIERRYTQLPADTPARLGEFTDELTADAESPYEEAVAIERWLESEKTYSLSASHEGGDVADTFVFEMEQGYCEYFATSMVAMLRTQDIPARYVVGYSAGQPRGEDEYVVRAMNAHAWVEVYVPERGWVRFDPTPARSRLSNEARAARSAASGDESAGEAADSFLDQARDPSGSRSGVPELPEDDGGRDGRGDLNRSELAENESEAPDATGAPNGSLDPTANASTNGTDADRPAIEITLLTDPVPGQSVTVEATRGRDPVVDAPVTFNGRRVGRTNASGMVTAPVPFARELVVGVADNATVRRAGSAAVGLGAGIALRAPDAGPVAGGRAMLRDGNATGNETTERFDVPTDLSLAVSGDVEPGATVTVRTTLANRSVADANVSVDGERVGRTGRDGTLDVSLPAAESTTIAATRGVANGSRTLTLANVSVATSGFALPELSVTVSVTDGGDPVEGAEVAVGGQTVTTGPDGEAKVSLPVATSATVAVTTPAGITKTTTVPYQFLTLGLLVALALALVVAAWYLHRRASAAGHSLTEHLSTLAAWLPGAFVALLVALAVRGETLLDRIPAIIAAAVRELRAALRAAVAAVRAQDLSVVVDAIPDPRVILAAVLAWVRGLLADARAAVPAGGSDDQAAESAAEDTDPAPVQSGPTARERIEQAWADFRERVPASDRDAMTPGELAREAVDAGFPDAPVRTLTDAFRRIEYGRRDPHGHVEAAERARDEIVAAGGEAGTNAGPVGEDGAATDGGTDVPADERTGGDDPNDGGGGADD